MSLRIHQLSPELANQIAAGEVIERPASVVKELLENSLDAGADTIHIDLNYGGLNQIKISDNGLGIVAEDLPLAVSAHATSKINSLSDLYALGTMGFRGEALASIASVAKVIISSRTAEQEHAQSLVAEGGNYSIYPCARAVGTTVEVSDLFFNAPVRKRFLKNERIEFQAIDLVAKRFALSAPQIALTLRHNNKLIFSLPAALNKQSEQARVTKLFGSAFIKDAVFLHVEQGSMKLYGWVSGPGFQRSQSDRQWIYINQRMVKDKLINHALKVAYDGLLHEGRFPSCLLYFDIDPAEVDVNVHPTKHEVRFEQPRLVHGFLMTHLMSALGQVYKNEVPKAVLHTNAYHVCEPEPKLIHSTKMNNSLGSNLRHHHRIADDGSSWIKLNEHFSLIFIEEQPHIVNVLHLYQHWLRQELTSQSFPLASRPVLVPITHESQRLENCEPKGLLSRLEQLGINAELIRSLPKPIENGLRIHSLPIQCPHTALPILIESLCVLDECSAEQLLEKLSAAQQVDLAFLSSEEKAALSHYLRSQQDLVTIQSKIYKQITLEDCRMLLDV
jgi:DNA mismatch repair protein MutL